MSLLRTVIVAGVAYWYGKHRAQQEANTRMAQVIAEIEAQASEMLEGEASPVIEAGKEHLQGFPAAWAARDYTLN